MSRRKARSPWGVRIAIGIAVAVAIGGGVVAVISGQKAAEHRDYLAVVGGPACHPVASPPDFVRSATPKSVDFGGAHFRYLRGDADCETVRPGRFGRDEPLPYCVFDRPGYVGVSAGAAHADYVVPVGQLSVLIEGATLRCTVKAPE